MSFTPLPYPAPPRSFGDAISTCLRKYATFTGRASRSEYWWFSLFNFLASVVALMTVPELNFLVSIGLFLPGLAVCIRRLHDIDRSGWWFLIAFVPLAGAIVLIVFMCLPGIAGPTRFDEQDPTPTTPYPQFPAAAHPGMIPPPPPPPPPPYR